MQLLVTGGAGFIGSAFVRRVLLGAEPSLAGAEVVVLDKLTYAGNEANLAPVAGNSRLRLVRGDVTDAPLVADLCAGVDAVVHFAAESHVDRSITGPEAFVLTNVVGTQVLLEAAVRCGVQRFVHVSTDEVYGSIASGSWREDHPLEPSSPYAASKASSDLLARAYWRTHELPVCITRCSNNYGPYQYPEKAIPLFVTNLLDGGDVPLYGDGLHVRDWLHVDDHCRGVTAVLENGRPGEIYHIAGGAELSNRDLVDLLLNEVDADWCRVRTVPDRQAHDRRYSLDWSKIRDELGYEPTVPFQEGLSATVRWYELRRDWWEPLKQCPA